MGKNRLLLCPDDSGNAPPQNEPEIFHQVIRKYDHHQFIVKKVFDAYPSFHQAVYPPFLNVLWCPFRENFHKAIEKKFYRYRAVYPPSIASSLPVTNFDSSDAKNKMPKAMSSGSPMWPRRCRNCLKTDSANIEPSNGTSVCLYNAFTKLSLYFRSASNTSRERQNDAQNNGQAERGLPICTAGALND